MSSVAMNFMTPERYSKSQNSHVVINTNAANEFAKFYGPLDENDKVLDIGSGSGETTAMMAEGDLGNLGSPGLLVGSDLSSEMVNHCRKKYNVENLTFEKLDVTKGKNFHRITRTAFLW